MFLKRAALFFMQLHRRLGWFEEEIGDLHIPADYRLPQSLQALGCIEYSPELENKIYTGQLIASGSLEEVKIRAATILACDELSKLSGYNSFQIDWWLWKNRFDDKPFHLTVTTDY